MVGKRCRLSVNPGPHSEDIGDAQGSRGSSCGFPQSHPRLLELLAYRYKGTVKIVWTYLRVQKLWSFLPIHAVHVFGRWVVLQIFQVQQCLATIVISTVTGSWSCILDLCLITVASHGAFSEVRCLRIWYHSQKCATVIPIGSQPQYMWSFWMMCPSVYSSCLHNVADMQCHPEGFPTSKACVAHLVCRTLATLAVRRYAQVAHLNAMRVQLVVYRTCLKIFCHTQFTGNTTVLYRPLIWDSEAYVTAH